MTQLRKGPTCDNKCEYIGYAIYSGATGWDGGEYLYRPIDLFFVPGAACW
jgi:hypothetical protein